jgi:hypothetical protein
MTPWAILKHYLNTTYRAWITVRSVMKHLHRKSRICSISEGSIDNMKGSQQNDRMNIGFENGKVSELAEIWRRNACIGACYYSHSLLTSKVGAFGRHFTIGTEESVVTPKQNARNSSSHFDQAAKSRVLNLTEQCEQAVKLTEKFCELIPTLGKLVSSFCKRFRGIAHSSFEIEDPAAVSEIQADAARYATSGISAIVVYQSELEKGGRRDVNPTQWKEVFRKPGRHKDYQKLVDLYDVKYYQQPVLVREEPDSRYPNDERKERADRWISNREQYEKMIYRLAPGAIGEMKNKWVKPKEMNADKYLKDNFFAEATTNFTGIGIDLENIGKPALINTMGVAAADIAKMYREIAELHNKYGSVIPVTRNTEPVFPLPTYDEWGNSETNIGRASKDLPISETGLVMRSAREERAEQEYKTFSKPTAGGKIVSININKPMIENFTINTKEMREGMRDFKHKVEEVLVEILNSAGAIH